MDVPAHVRKNLIDFTAYPIDETADVYVHLGLDPNQNYWGAFHISRGARYVAMGSTAMEMVDFLAGYFVNIMDDPAKVAGFVYAHGDLVFSVIRGRGRARSKLLIQNDKKRQNCVFLERDHVLTLRDLKDTYTRDLMKKINDVRPDVMDRANHLVADFLKKIPILKKIESSDEMGILFSQVFGDHTKYQGRERQLLDAASKELIKLSYHKFKQRKIDEECRRSMVQVPFKIIIPK